MIIKKTSIISGEENTLDLDITEEQLQRFNAGDGLVQEIFPHLAPSEREFLMTGITEVEWDKHVKVD